MTDFNPDGPHSPDLTKAAAGQVADLIRYLNYATRAGSSGLDLDAAYALLGTLAEALDRLPQVIAQLDAYLAAQYSEDRLAAADGGSVTGLISGAGAELRSAGHAANSLAARLHLAQNAVATLKESGDD